MTAKSYFDEAVAAVFAYRRHAASWCVKLAQEEADAFNRTIEHFNRRFSEHADAFEFFAFDKEHLLNEAIERYPFAEDLDLSIFFTTSRTIDDQMFGLIYRESRAKIASACTAEFASDLSCLRIARERKLLLLQRNYNDYHSRLQRAELRMRTPYKAASSVKNVVSIYNDIQLEGVM